MAFVLNPSSAPRAPGTPGAPARETVVQALARCMRDNPDKIVWWVARATGALEKPIMRARDSADGAMYALLHGTVHESVPAHATPFPPPRQLFAAPAPLAIDDAAFAAPRQPRP